MADRVKNPRKDMFYCDSEKKCDDFDPFFAEWIVAIAANGTW